MALKKFIDAVKEYRAAKKNIKELKPQIAQRKVQGKFLRGERMTVAESRSVQDTVKYDNQAKRRSNPSNTKVR
jgi:hypothetical protein